ncbi:type-2 ice-structuring protein-like [Eriocheir sinensis]|uniref:type-2 ice-structuring protein-like n=1 Tax=Eriocheir sinensis TaxID=95602 RepID=UPI0021C99F51|nr:type-2 ice-structuring protein-like [Eriocheir sinensis]
MMGVRVGVAVQLVLVGVAAVVSATPLQQGDDPAAVQSLFPDLVETVKELVNTDKGVQEQLLATMRDIAGTQERLQQFLMGGAPVASEMTAAESESDSDPNNNLIYFTRNVVAALNAGNNTQLEGIMTELKNLNDNFKVHFKSVACPEPFMPLGDECFNFQLEDLSWNASRTRCLKLGGELAIPKNLTQVRLFINQNFPRKNRRNFWLGAIENNKVWEWLSGDAVNPDLWYTNEPSGNGDCLAMFDGWEHPLSDFPCERERRAICERVMRLN